MNKKPSSWYNQSAVIPFRISNKNLEILIITTRKKKKWIIPKGIIEDGLSPQGSALKEAIEEAGVSGEVLEKSLGSYFYKKWGGNCEVKVYALEVNNIFETWEEDFRERKWIPPDCVHEYINSKKILKIIEKFKVQSNSFKNTNYFK